MLTCQHLVRAFVFSGCKCYLVSLFQAMSTCQSKDGPDLLLLYLSTYVAQERGLESNSAARFRAHFVGFWGVAVFLLCLYCCHLRFVKRLIESGELCEHRVSISHCSSIFVFF